MSSRDRFAALPVPMAAVSGAGAVGQGIAYMVAQVSIFAISNALVKWSAQSYPVWEVAFFRNLVALGPILMLTLLSGGAGLLRTRHPLSHAYRGGIGVVSMLMIFYGFKVLPIADATAISFTAPLFLTALSVPLLKERVGIYRWSAVIAGFAGVLIISPPGHGLFHWGVLAVIGSSVTYALAMISVRQMSRTEHPITISFYFALIGTLVMGLLLPLGWKTPDLLGLAVLTAIGLIGGIGQYLLSQAFRLAPAAVAAPFNYLAIVVTGLLGYVFWSEIPEWHVVLGSLVVIASGLFVAYRETVRRRQVSA